MISRKNKPLEWLDWIKFSLKKQTFKEKFWHAFQIIAE